MSRWQAWQSPCLWALDKRSLALCRIATGLVILGDLASRAQSFRIHYTDDGILPRQLLYDIQALRFPTVYAMSGCEVFLGALFLFHGLVALSLCLGYRTRLSGFLAWYLTVSLQERMFMANNGGDKVLASILFWGLFLPWGEALSLDSREAVEGSSQVSSMATAIFMMQPIMMYWVSVFHKLEPTWLRGEVLAYALQSDFYAYPVGQVLLPYTGLMRVMAYLTFFWELLGPLLLLSTRPRLRLFACLVFMLMHAGFGIFLRIGVFAFSPMLYMLGMLPSALWTSRRGGRLQVALQGLFRKARPKAPSSSGPMTLGRPVSLALGALFLYVCLIALSQDKRIGRLTPESMDWLANITGLNQRWSVFIDTPRIFDGWMVVEATMADGREVDLFQGFDPARWGKPGTPYHRFDSFRWPTPLVVISGDRRYHKWFVRGLALDWQREHPEDKVTWASLMLFQETPRLDPKGTTVERVVLWQGNPL